MRKLFLGILFSGMATVSNAKPVHHFTLENGLDVVVIENHRAPVVMQMIWYKVGAADEPPGHSGIAHFFEHLMFKATDKIAAGEFSAIVAAQGGEDNAFTGWDYTAYYQRIAADRLEMVMPLEANRMRNLKLTEDVVAPERGVILEERSQRVDSDPEALFDEQTQAAQYLNHPYGIPVIGWRHEIEGLTQKDAEDFYRTFYAPNNATLIIAGDVQPDKVRAMAQKYYGDIPPTPNLPERVRPKEPPQISERRLQMHDARIAEPAMTRTYLSPARRSGDQKEAAALIYLAELLGGNANTSILGKALQHDQKKAVQTYAYYNGTAVDYGTFVIGMTPTPETSPADAEAALDKLIAEFLEKGADLRAFERIKTQLKASDIYAQDNLEAQVERYGAALSVGLTLDDVNEWPVILQNVTPNDVMTVAKKILRRQQAVTGWQLPQEGQQ